MRQSNVLLVVGVVLLTASTALALDVGATDAASAAQDASQARVLVQNFGFHDEQTGAPITVIEAGGSVEWVWASGCHSVTDGVRGADNEPLGPSAFDSQVRCAQVDDQGKALTTFETTFGEPGVYTYYCKPHPQMEGLLVVLPGGAS